MILDNQIYSSASGKKFDISVKDHYIYRALEITVENEFEEIKGKKNVA